jgi:hypothetical protein
MKVKRIKEIQIFSGEGGIGFADPLGGGAKVIINVRSLRSLPFLFSASGSSELDRPLQTKMPALGRGH